MYLYDDCGTPDPAYFIIPDPSGTIIRHQYGCRACQHFEIIGRVELIPKPTATVLAEALECIPWPVEMIRLHTGLPVAEVLGESLARLDDGRYIATENCD